jgi:membrane protein
MSHLMEWLQGFIKYLYDRLFRHELAYAASALTITTLLALVPMLSVIFTILARLPIGEDFSHSIESFIFNHFVPSISDNLQNQFQQFLKQAAQVGTLGFTILVITALILMNNIDKVFRKIWHGSKRRKALSSILIYWCVLILGPLLLGLSILLSSYFTSMLMLNEQVRELGIQLTYILPFLLTIIGLTLLYWLIPNARVKLLEALTGALVAGLLFELVKRLFTWYAISFPLQKVIFGALSVIPLFMLWVYLSWLIVLVGAEITHGLRYYKIQFRKRQKAN